MVEKYLCILEVLLANVFKIMIAIIGQQAVLYDYYPISYDWTVR